MRGEEIGFLVASQRRWKELKNMDCGWNVIPATRGTAYSCIGTKIANANRNGNGSVLIVPSNFEATCDSTGYMIDPTLILERYFI